MKNLSRLFFGLFAIGFARAEAKNSDEGRSCILSMKQIEQIQNEYRNSAWANQNNQDPMVKIQKDSYGQIIDLSVFNEKTLSESRVDDRSQ